MSEHRFEPVQLVVLVPPERQPGRRVDDVRRGQRLVDLDASLLVGVRPQTEQKQVQETVEGEGGGIDSVLSAPSVELGPGVDDPSGEDGALVVGRPATDSITSR